jgi:hypothetical protein
MSVTVPPVSAYALVAFTVTNIFTFSLHTVMECVEALGLLHLFGDFVGFVITLCISFTVFFFSENLTTL